MSNPVENFTGEIAPVQNFEDAMREIKEAWSGQNPAVLKTAQLLAKAWETFNGQQKIMADRLGMSASELNKLLKIGDCPLLYDAAHQPMLPGGMTLLWELTMIKHLDDAFRNGAIKPSLTRADIKVLRQRFAKRELPWHASPPTQDQTFAEEDTAPVSRPARKSKNPRPPKGMFAVIEMPKTKTQMDAIFAAMDALRQAGVVVHDQWSIESKKQSDNWDADEREIIKLVERAVRQKIKEKKREYRKKGKSHLFDETFGTDELELDGDLDIARRVYGIIADESDFDIVVEDIRRAHKSRGYISVVPSFEFDANESQAVLDALAPKKRDPRDFEKLNYD